MKSAKVFLGGLASVLACNLMLISVCSSAPMRPLPPAAAPPPPPVPPAPVVRIEPRAVEIPYEPAPIGLFMWGCGAHLSADADGAVALPICAPLLKL